MQFSSFMLAMLIVNDALTMQLTLCSSFSIAAIILKPRKCVLWLTQGNCQELHR